MSRILTAALVVFCAVFAASQLSGGSYEDLPAESKWSYIYSRVTADNNKAGPWPSKLSLAKLFIESMDFSMDNVNDEIDPNDRQKLIHCVGSVAGVEWKMLPNNYTGLFKGSTFGFVRISHALQPDESKASPIDGSFIPGASFKLLRNKVPSGNMVFMRALAPADSWNPFKHIWSNHVSSRGLSFALKIVKLKFDTASKWSTYLGLSDIAKYDEQGNQTPDAELNFPFQLLFVPHDSVATVFPDSFQADMKDQLATLPAGSNLWNIYAMSDPMAKAEQIGTVVTTTPFFKSVYGDQKLFIKHQRFDDDLKLRPQWKKICPDLDHCDTCPLDVNCTF